MQPDPLETVTASEIANWVYCPEAWRLDRPLLADACQRRFGLLDGLVCGLFGGLLLYPLLSQPRRHPRQLGHVTQGDGPATAAGTLGVVFFCHWWFKMVPLPNK